MAYFMQHFNADYAMQNTNLNKTEKEKQLDQLARDAKLQMKNILRKS